MIGVSTNGVITLPYNANTLCCSPEPIAPGGSGDAVITRIAVAQEDLDPRYGGGVYVKQAVDGNSVTISWENVPFFGSSGTLVNAQATLHKTGSVTFCYGSGNSGSNSIAAGLEDDEFNLTFPMPLSGFNAGGVSSSFPQNSCACFVNGCVSYLSDRDDLIFQVVASSEPMDASVCAGLDDAIN